MTRICISSGHGLHVRGASGHLDERNENVRVVDKVYELLTAAGVPVKKYHENTATTQNQNLNNIVNWHNAQTRDLDVSVHFNSGGGTGTEVLYVTQDVLAKKVSKAIADVAGWPNRGGKHRSDLFFLNNTEEPAILIEVCFVDSSSDADVYRRNFDPICHAIANSISGQTFAPPIEELPPADVATFTGPMSVFGGPDDTGVDTDEGLAMYSSVDQQPNIFLDYQPSGTSGLARRLNPAAFYVACRWDYEQTSKEYLRTVMVEVKAEGSDGRTRTQTAYVGDYGPHESTGRIADLSPGLAAALGLGTDDICTITVPLPQSGGAE
jgi:N-acetylmuramoyl-L-alanine amidase